MLFKEENSMWRLKQWFPAICMLMCLAAPAPSHAECSLTFIPIEESKYLLKGEGFERIAAVTFTVDYDTTYLFAPDVVVMGGRLLEEDRGAATPPGNLQLHILNEEHNAVFEATIYFEKRGDYPAVINFVRAEVADLSGALRPVPVEMVAPVNSPQSEAVPAVTTPESAPAAPSLEVGAETLAHELGVTADGLPPADPPARTPAAAAPTVPQADIVPAAPRKKRVAERFRDFNGKKSLAAFRSLISGADPCCSQIPPVMIADGKRTARVVISGVGEGDGAPRFTVSGGRLISVERGTKKEEWILVIRPYEKGWDVRVSATFADETIDFPLIVAPAIEIPRHKLAEISEKSFMPRLRSFLAGKPRRANQKSPVWLSEYLFTANYLAAQP
jgi:hypothetical protein